MTLYCTAQVPQLLAYLKEHFPVQPGDWVLTGTPEGVAAVKTGDKVRAQVSRKSDGAVLSEGSWDVRGA